MYAQSADARLLRRETQRNQCAHRGKALGIHGKKQQTNVDGLNVLSWSGNDVHAAAKVLKVHSIGFGKERAPHFFEIAFYQEGVKVSKVGLVIWAIVKRDVVCQGVELALFLYSRGDGR